MRGGRFIAPIALITLTTTCAGDPGEDAARDDRTTEGGEVTDPSTNTRPTGSTGGGGHHLSGGGAEASEDHSLGTGDGTFEMRTETFTDTSRPTSPAIPQRDLVTDIYVPGGEGPFPLVMHAHGFNGTSAKFSQLLGHWAEAGYLVVAPNFPRTNGNLPEDQRDLGDYLNQPGDVRFTLDRVLAMNEPGGGLEGLISTDHMGISGLSLGGATTYPLLFNSCCRDERYVSGILMSALELPFEDHSYDYSRRIPILAFAGTDDDAIPYELQQQTLSRLAGPKWNVTLPGGQHSQPFEDNPSPQDDLVSAATVDFWDLTLRDDESAAERLVANTTVEGLSFVDVTP